MGCHVETYSKMLVALLISHGVPSALTEMLVPAAFGICCQLPMWDRKA
jgi:hypothetical protein